MHKISRFTTMSKDLILRFFFFVPRLALWYRFMAIKTPGLSYYAERGSVVTDRGKLTEYICRDRLR